MAVASGVLVGGLSPAGNGTTAFEHRGVRFSVRIVITVQRLTG